jgi:hypothetical protein
MWRLRWTDRNGNTLSTLGDPGHYASIALSPDETRLVVEQGYPNKEIWTYNLQRGSGARLTVITGGSKVGAVTQDGQRFLIITTDTPELLNIPVLTDWTTLLPGVPASR